MFGDETAIAWSDFFGGSGSKPEPLPDSAADTITTTTTAASARNVSELQAQIRRNGGVITTGPNSSDYLVAVNNRLRFSVTRNASGQFEIRESDYLSWIVGAAAVLGAVLLTRR